jgi:hypothetical protein
VEHDAEDRNFKIGASSYEIIFGIPGASLGYFFISSIMTDERTDHLQILKHWIFSFASNQCVVPSSRRPWAGWALVGHPPRFHHVWSAKWPNLMAVVGSE